jgi:hypothetical protein
VRSPYLHLGLRTSLRDDSLAAPTAGLRGKPPMFPHAHGTSRRKDGIREPWLAISRSHSVAVAANPKVTTLCSAVMGGCHHAADQRTGQTAQAHQIIRESVIPCNRGRRFAYSQKTACIGVRNEERGKFQTCVSHAITGQWVYVPYELLVNGKPIEHDWQEVTS